MLQNAGHLVALERVVKPLDGLRVSQEAGVVPVQQHSDRSIIMSLC
jgi:hypothetical protein